MNINQTQIENDLKESVSKQVALQSEGVNRFRVFTPFEFEDGDHFAIVLKKENKNWRFSDEAHTLMHMSYDMDISALKKGNRQKILTNILSNFQIVENSGELSLNVIEDNFGGALYNFIQALTKITDISYLSKEQVRSTFYEDFKSFLKETVPEDRLTFDYSNDDYDKDCKYPVDCRINGMPKPLFLFAIHNDNKCRDVVISLLQYERWGLKYQSVSIFEDQETINRRVLAKFSDVGEKQFSALYPNQDRINKYLSEQL